MTHKPATQFPSGLQMDRGSIVGPMGTFYGTLGDCQVAFAHGLIHRANAYPRLVAALREACKPQRNGEALDTRSKGRDLLAELGE